MYTHSSITVLSVWPVHRRVLILRFFHKLVYFVTGECGYNLIFGGPREAAPRGARAATGLTGIPERPYDPLSGKWVVRDPDLRWREVNGERVPNYMPGDPVPRYTLGLDEVKARVRNNYTSMIRQS